MKPTNTWKERIRTMIRKRFAKWPRRTARYPVRILLTEDQKDRPRCLNDIVRQAGYTNGDRMVVMLESDFQKVADIAQKKIDRPLLALSYSFLFQEDLRRLTTPNQQQPHGLPKM